MTGPAVFPDAPPRGSSEPGGRPSSAVPAGVVAGLLERCVARFAPSRPGPVLAVWGALALGGIAAALAGSPAASAALMLGVVAVVGLAPATRDAGPGASWGAWTFVRRAGEVALAAGVLLAAGWAGDTGTAALWPAWIAAIAVVAEAYTGSVFRQDIASAGLGRAGDVGVTSSDGRPIGWVRVPAWASAARLAPGDAPVWAAAALLCGRSVEVLWVAAGVAVLGWMWTTLARGAVLRALDRAANRREPRLPEPGVRRWKTLLEGAGRSGDDSFWGVCCGQGVALLLHGAVFRVAAATPNVVTTVSTALGLVLAGVAVHPAGWVPWVVIPALQVRNGMDALDGQIARLRGAGSYFGSFFDKVSDSLCWAALFAATGVLAGRQVGERWAVLVPLAAAVALTFQGVTFWLDKRSGPKGAAGPARDAPGSFARRCLRSIPAVVRFEEPDFYLWFSISLALGEWRPLLLALVAFYSVRVVGIGAYRVRRSCRA